MLLYGAGLESISRCTKLLSLKMGVCPNITDCGLSHVAMSCQKLIELDLYRHVNKFITAFTFFQVASVFL